MVDVQDVRFITAIEADPKTAHTTATTKHHVNQLRLGNVFAIRMK